MRAFILIGALFLAGLQAVWGQINVQITLDQDVYLSGESVIVKVDLVNLSGQTVRLGETPDWLEFTIESVDSPYVSRLKEMDMTSAFDLGASMRASREINIYPYFDVVKTGRYKVTAVVHVPNWGETYLSGVQIFDVIRGVELIGYDVGVPVPKIPVVTTNEVTKVVTTNLVAAVTGAPEIRHYSLVRVAYLDKMRLYVRITNLERQKIFCVIPVCGMLTFSEPKAMVDADSNLHIINQVYAKRFIYFVMNTDGVMIKREFYDYIGSKPVLYQNEDGSINVHNGVRMWTEVDYPPSPRPVAPPSIVTRPGDSITNAVPDLKKMTKEEKKRYKEEQKRLKEEKRRLEKEEKKRKEANEKD